MTVHPDAATVAALALAAVATVVVGAYGGRVSRTTSDFLVASRSIGPRWNAAAISGEYLSAASFLGVAGLVAKYGADALWYPIGFTVGYLGLLLFVAAPLRRSGAYTVPDFAEFRLGSRRVRIAATVVVTAICVGYLVPQFQGAGLALHILLGAPTWVGAVTVGAIVVVNVVGGGMRSITFVQAFQYWLKLTAVAIPAIALSIGFIGDDRELGSPAPPTVAQATTVDVTTDVIVTVADPAGLRVDGRVDGRDVADAELAAGRVRIGAGSELRLAAGAAVPVVAGAPTTGADWIVSGRGLGGDHPLFTVLSLMVATFLGTLGLPHVLVRFYTNRDGRAARRTALAVIGLLGVFYLFPTLLGVVARVYVPELLITGASDAAVLLVPRAAFSGWLGTLLAALVAAGAVAAFLSTASGLLVSLAGALATDVLRGRVRDFRVAALVGGAVPVALTFAVGIADLSRVVGLAFGIAASTLCPLLVLGIWWRGLTSAGAIAGMAVGGLASTTASVLALAGAVDPALGGGWPAAIIGYPAAVTVPLAFTTMALVSHATRASVPDDVGRLFARMHVPERLGLGVERVPDRGR